MSLTKKNLLALMMAFCGSLVIGGLFQQVRADSVGPDRFLLTQVKDKKKDKVVPKEVLPATLSIVAAKPGSKASTLTLQQIKYSGATAFGRPVGGTADLHLTLVGHALPVLKNQKFTGTVHDKFGKTSGFQITLGEDLAATHFLGGKLDLILEKGGHIVDTAAKAGSSTYHFNGSVRFRLPYVSENGKPVEVHLGKGPARKAIEIPLSAAAFALAEKEVATTQTTLLMDGFKLKGVQVFHTLQLQVHPQQSQPYDLETSLGKTEIIAYLPRFLLKEGFPVHAAEVKIEKLPTVKKDASEHYASTFFASTTQGVLLTFIRPMGYEFDTGNKGDEISLKVVKGETIEAKAKGSLTLPANFVDETWPHQEPEPKTKKGFQKPDPSKPKTSAQKQDPSTPWTDPPDATSPSVHVTLTYQTGKGRAGWSCLGDKLKLSWNNRCFWLQADAYSLVLDGPGGLKVTSGFFDAKAIGSVPLQSGDSFVLLSSGATGQVTLNLKDINKNFHIPGTTYQAVITDPAKTWTWHFSQGNLSASQNFTAKVQFKQANADMEVSIAVTPYGDPSVSLGKGTVSLPDYGIYLAYNQGSVKSQLFHLSGTMTFDTPKVPQLKTIAVPITNIIINSDGLFGDPKSHADPKHDDQTGDTRIPVGQIDVDFKSFVLVLQSVDLPHSQQKVKHLSLNGQAKLSDDLPLIPYDPGLSITPTQSTGQLDVDRSGAFVSVAADGPAVPNFGSLHVQKPLGFAFIDFTLSQDKQTFGGETVDCWTGKGTLKLAGGDAGINDGVTMFVAKGAWLVYGKKDLGQAAIPLGTTPLKLYGFRGGLGNNINVKPSVIGSGSAAGDLKLDDFVYAPGNFLFQAGLGIETTDEFLAWGDALLTITTAPMSFNMAVNLNLVETRNGNPSGDRTATGLISFTGDTIDAVVAVDLNVLSRSVPLAAMSGTAAFHVDKSYQYVHIGWPGNSARISVIDGLLSLDGGMALEYRDAGQYQGVRVGASFGWQGSFLGILSGELDGWLGAQWGDAGTGIGGQIHVYGDVDFYIFSASAEAWLGGGLNVDPFEVWADGTIEGCIDTCLGSACASVHFSGTWP